MRKAGFVEVFGVILILDSLLRKVVEVQVGKDVMKADELMRNRRTAIYVQRTTYHFYLIFISVLF